MTTEWTNETIKTELQAIAQHVQATTTAYLVGGSAMVVRGFKPTTPDIDVVVASNSELSRLRDALSRAGVHQTVHQETAGNRGDFHQFSYNDGREIDVAHMQLGDGLVLSEGIRDRSEPVFEDGRLTVAAISPEDIYLRKLVSSRKKDLLDSKALLQASIDTDIVAAELQKQEALLDRKLPSMLAFNASDTRGGPREF